MPREFILRNGSTDPSSRYDFGGVLGAGTYGTVVAATERLTGEQYACKLLAKARLLSEADVDDVRREIAIANHMTEHPGIVSLKNTYECANYLYLVMEMCWGGELFDYIVEKGSYSEREAAEVFTAMVEVVHHCHALGVCHRDLKPENFLLATRGDGSRLKIIDFGLSQFFKPGDRFLDRAGSPYYVAPEVLRKDSDNRSDMWSLGVILYILLSGVPPFYGKSERDIFAMVLGAEPDFNIHPWPEMSAEAIDCVRSLLQRDVDARATASQVLQHPWLRSQGQPDRPLDSVVLSRMRDFAKHNKLKKAALMVVGQVISEDHIEGTRRMFDAIDTDGNGRITVEEMREALKVWGHQAVEEHVTEIMARADVDQNGYIDFDEFRGATMHLSKLQDSETLQRAFNAFDTNGDGHISATEVEECMNRFGVFENVEALVQDADQNKDGVISFEEFKDFMRSGGQITGTWWRMGGAAGSPAESLDLDDCMDG